MNKKIQELAEQAALLGPSSRIGNAHEAAERFAELIVRECIDIASQEDFDVMMKEGYPCSQTAKKIREHFGVE